jgi:hypothetical protein
MIAEHIVRKTSQAGFKRLAAYILNEKDKGRSDPVDWKLAEYILDRENFGEKVASWRITNCVSDDPGWAVIECLALAARNQRATKDKTYHLVISFPEGERPTDEQMINIEDRLVEAIGFAEHKRISAVHQNTDNWHLHVAIVTVHPTTFRNVTPYYEHFRMQEACAELEIKHGLIRTPHALSGDRRQGAGLEARTGRMSLARWVEENAARPLIEAAAKAKAWQDLHREAAKFGLVFKPRGAGLVLATTANFRISIKASSVDQSLSFKALTDRLGPYEAPDITLAQQAPMMKYEGQPIGASSDLWERYQQERAQAMEARTVAMASLRNTHLRYGEEMERWHKQRYANAAAQHLSWADRQSTKQKLAFDKATERAKRRAVEKENRAKVKSQHQVITWAAFLAREASRGREPAVKALDRFVSKQIEREGEVAGRG